MAIRNRAATALPCPLCRRLDPHYGGGAGACRVCGRVDPPPAPAGNRAVVVTAAAVGGAAAAVTTMLAESLIAAVRTVAWLLYP